MLNISPRQMRQIGVTRLALVAGTYLDCAEGYRLLANAKAPDQVALIDRLLHSPVGDLRLEAQKERIAKRSQRQSSAARSVKKQDATVLEGLEDILKDDVRLSQLCRELANRGEQPSAVAMAARVFVQWCEALVEVDCTSSQRTLIASNRSQLEAIGLDPDASSDDKDESTWEENARLGVFGFRDTFIDTPAELSASEIEGLST